MVRRRTVYECPACMSLAEALNLTALGGKVRPTFSERDGRPLPGVVVRRVLCWWCREYHDPVEVETCMSLPRKAVSANGSPSSTSSALDAGPFKQYSELWALLTSTTFEDGTSRQTARLSLSYESGMLGLLLTDDETGQYAFLNGRSVVSLLEEAELRLADGSLSWRPSRYQGKARRK